MNPIFIIGNPRSGTTMLRLMLTCHANIGIPPESGWLIQLYDKYHDCYFRKESLDSFLDDLLMIDKIEEWHLDRDKLKSILQDVCPTDYKTISSMIYHFYAQTNGRKSRWGDKNNFFLHHINRIDKIFPEAQFIHIIRDGRDVACSYRDLAETTGRYAPTLPNSVFGAANNWNRNLKKIHKSFVQIASTRQVHIKYEDLVSEPEKTLRDICDFLGEGFDPSMLEFSERNKKEKLEPNIFMGWKHLTKMPTTSTRVARWKKEMFREDRLIFKIVAEGMLHQHDYEETIVTSRKVTDLFIYLYTTICQINWYIYSFFQKGARILKTRLAKMS